MGDFIIKETARRLLQAVRHADRVARIGGDEFALILKSATEQDARHLSDKYLLQ